MSRLRTAALLAPLVLTGALLAGCGEDDGTTVTDPGAQTTTPDASTGTSTSAPTSASTSASPVRGPSCADVWSEGATLPKGYDGCDDEGTWVKADGRYCEFGKPLITHDRRWYAVPGGRIARAEADLAGDPGYQDVLRKCSG